MRRRLKTVETVLFSLCMLLCFDAAQSAHAGPRCAAPDRTWTAQEKWVWSQICRGELANLSERYPSAHRVDDTTQWPRGRTLRAAFLRAVLIDRRWREYVPVWGVAIRGARLTGTLDLSDVTFPFSIYLIDSEVEELDMVNAMLPALNLDGSKFVKDLKLRGLQTRTALSLSNVRAPAVSAKSMKIGTDVEFGGSQVERVIDFERSVVGGSLFLKQSQMNALLLSAARVERDIEIDEATIADAAHLVRTFVGGSVLASKIQVRTLWLVGTRVEGNIDIDGSRVDDKIEVDMVRVQGKLSILKSHISGLSILASRITGDVDLSDSEITSSFHLGQSEISGTLFMRGTIVRLDEKSAEMPYLTVGKGIDLSGAKLRTVWMPAADVRGDLILGSSSLPPPEWADKAELQMPNSAFGAIQDSPPGASCQRGERVCANDAWPSSLDLVGISFKRFGPLDTNQQNPIAGRGAEWWVQLLNRNRTASPQPYQMIAGIFSASGDPEGSVRILYAAKERELEGAQGWQRVLLFLQKIFIGYGYYPFRFSIWWVLGFIVAGALVLRLSGEGRKNHMPYGLAYSFDMLLPAIKLRDAHYKIDLESPCARYYFYFHRIAGFVLAAFLVAGLSGLTKY